MSDDDKDDKRSPALKIEDGGMASGAQAQNLIKKLFDMEGCDFLGSGMSYHEWARLGDVLRYHRFFGNQAREERRRRMKYIVALSAEHERICQVDTFATAWSEATIEAVINGDWEEVKMWTESMEFRDENPSIRNIAAPKFARFVEIAREAWETRPKVFCPLCHRPTPEKHIARHHDGRHVCPWCKIVHDDAGDWVEQERANLSPVPEENDE